MSLKTSISRRKFLMFSGAASAMVATNFLGLSNQAFAASEIPVATTPVISTPVLTATPPSAFSLPALPYAENALEPYISAKTVSFHYGKHHAGYVKNLNGLVKGTKYEKLTLERIIKLTYNQFLLSSIYNNAAQTWNHTFYWNSLKPESGDKAKPAGKLLALINAQFGHFSDNTKDANSAWTNAGFKEKLFDAAKGHFGSGWVWVVLNKQNKLEILTTKNADSPLTKSGYVPLLVIDVWEHAYYLDYQNGRVGYLTAVLDNIINWQFAENNLPATLKV
jgi:Fe-Mn family superoxide dismutase